MTRRRQGHLQPGFWITGIRAILSIVLGIALIFSPEKTNQIFFNFMGMFWLMSGIAITRREWQVKESRLLFVAGLIGFLAGVLVVARHLARNFLAENLVIFLLGAIIILTGILHISGGFKKSSQTSRTRTIMSVTWGIFEIILGLLVVISDGNKGPVLYWIASIWALFAGVYLFLDAMRQYRSTEIDTAH